MLVCKDRVTNFLHSSHHAGLHEYEVVFDITPTELSAIIRGLQGDRSCGVAAANTNQRASLYRLLPCADEVFCYFVNSSKRQRAQYSAVLILCNSLRRLLLFKLCNEVQGNQFKAERHNVNVFSNIGGETCLRTDRRTRPHYAFNLWILCEELINRLFLCPRKHIASPLQT